MEDNGLKDLAGKLGLSKKQGEGIDTERLRIKENTIYYSWDKSRETALQISNISQIDIGPAPKAKIPGWLIATLVVGIALILLRQFMLGVVLTAFAGICIYLIGQGNMQAGDNLIIHLNSGRYFLFNFKDKAFLSRVFNVLIDCVNHKTVGETIISISNSTIQSSAIGTSNQMEK